MGSIDNVDHLILQRFRWNQKNSHACSLVFQKIKNNVTKVVTLIIQIQKYMVIYSKTKSKGRNIGLGINLELRYLKLETN